MVETVKPSCKCDEKLVQMPSGAYECWPAKQYRTIGDAAGYFNGLRPYWNENCKEFWSPCQTIKYTCPDLGDKIQEEKVCPGGEDKYTNKTEAQIEAEARNFVKNLWHRQCRVPTHGVVQIDFDELGPHCVDVQYSCNEANGETTQKTQSVCTQVEKGWDESVRQFIKKLPSSCQIDEFSMGRHWFEIYQRQRLGNMPRLDPMDVDSIRYYEAVLDLYLEKGGETIEKNGRFEYRQALSLSGNPSNKPACNVILIGSGDTEKEAKEYWKLKAMELAKENPLFVPF